jgi:hypothetical protein
LHGNAVRQLYCPEALCQAVSRTLAGHGEAILDRQAIQEPIAPAAIEIFASICVLSRRDAEIQEGDRRRGAGPKRDDASGWQPAAATLFLTQSARCIRDALRQLHDRDYAAITGTAADVLESG